MPLLRVIGLEGIQPEMRGGTYPRQTPYSHPWHLGEGKSYVRVCPSVGLKNCLNVFCCREDISVSGQQELRSSGRSQVHDISIT